MKRLAPGVYDDGKGGMHLDVRELLLDVGFADTPENRATFAKAWREWSAQTGTPVTLTDEPIIRTATDAEQHAALVQAARRMVVDQGAGHECSEWRGADGRCELCGREVWTRS